MKLWSGEMVNHAAGGRAAVFILDIIYMQVSSWRCISGNNCQKFHRDTKVGGYDHNTFMRSHLENLHQNEILN